MPAKGADEIDEVRARSEQPVSVVASAGDGTHSISATFIPTDPTLLQFGDFTGGGHSLPGDDLGWTPEIITQDAAQDALVSVPIPAGTSPGLHEGAGLAAADPDHGLGTTVVGAGPDLRIPSGTAAGSYSATLTLTVFEQALP